MLTHPSRKPLVSNISLIPLHSVFSVQLVNGLRHTVFVRLSNVRLRRPLCALISSHARDLLVKGPYARFLAANVSPLNSTCSGFVSNVVIRRMRLTTTSILQAICLVVLAGAWVHIFPDCHRLSSRRKSSRSCKLLGHARIT